jgi:hypothetical protein
MVQREPNPWSLVPDPPKRHVARIFLQWPHCNKHWFFLAVDHNRRCSIHRRRFHARRRWPGIMIKLKNLRKFSKRKIEKKVSAIFFSSRKLDFFLARFEQNFHQKSFLTSQNFAPIWFPHCPACTCRISRILSVLFFRFLKFAEFEFFLIFLLDCGVNWLTARTWMTKWVRKDCCDWNLVFRKM